MRAIFALVLVAGMALAGFAVYMAQGYLNHTQAQLAAATQEQAKLGALVEVYAAKAAMKFGDPLTEGDVRTVWVQKAFMPAGAFVVNRSNTTGATGAAATDDEGALFAADSDKPRYLARSLEPNEIILASRVTEPGRPASLTGKLGAGMRAYQIRVESTGVQGFVMPDSLIDVYWTGSADANGGDVTRLIESGMLVLAVDGASAEGDRTGYGIASTITVAATPEQVARLAQAQATGKMTMSLIAAAGDAVSGLVEVDRNALLGVEAKQEVAAAPAPEPEVCSIRTRRGEEVVEVPVPCTTN